MARLILVRHSTSQPDPAQSSAAWSLSQKGRERCRPLADQLAGLGLAAVFTSQELKAVETGRLLARYLKLPLAEAEGLHEQARDNEGWLGDNAAFVARMGRFFRQPDRLVFGQETAEQALNRFSGAVARLVTAQPGQNIAIVSHGTVMSLFIARQAGLDPFALWQSLTMPAYAALTVPGYQLEWLVTSLEAPPVASPR
jgi:broad specificity phosphatase PhoE